MQTVKLEIFGKHQGRPDPLIAEAYHARLTHWMTTVELALNE